MRIFRTLLALSIVFMSCAALLSAGAGTRASFTRGGWVGARYVAMGMSGEVMADDVFAIYWNPAGLTELKGKTRMTAGDVQKKARDGKVDEIREDDLLQFSEETGEKFFFQVGASAAKLDVERNVGFVGFACKFFNGVIGVGSYTIMSTGIESRDETGAYIRDLSYVASVEYLSYALTIGGVASLGVSAKMLYEDIGNVRFMGAGADIGVQIYVLPFVKIGFVAQDLGSGLYPIEDYSGIKKRYDLASPVLRLGVAFISSTGLSVALSGIKKLEQDEFFFNLGVQYDLMRHATIYLGLNNAHWFSAGLTVHLSNFDLSYAFSIDNINNGYNNLVSFTIVF